MLSLNNIEVIYDGVILVLKGVSLNVREAGITTLLGANGAGKTTTLKAISGLLPSERGAITKGAIELGGERIDRLPPHAVVRRGVVQVFEGRRVFEHLTTEENLIAGGHIQADRSRLREGIERVYEYFPRLGDRWHVQSGYLSGGGGDLPDRAAHEPAGAGDRAAGRAERHPGPDDRRTRLRHGERPHRAGGQRRRAPRERRHQGVLSRSHRGRRPQVVSRGQALQAPQTLAQPGGRPR